MTNQENIGYDFDELDNAFDFDFDVDAFFDQEQEADVGTRGRRQTVIDFSSVPF